MEVNGQSKEECDSELLEKCKYFPTSAMFNRQSNFMKFDLETLFFAFYFMQDTYQQFLAAQELKRRGWDFHIRFQTWIQIDKGDGKTKPKTIYFDYENEWKIRTFTNNEIQIDDPKISSQIENELKLPAPPIPNANSQEASECLNQESFERHFTIGSLNLSDLPRDVAELLVR